MKTITDCYAKQILDSRGSPTLEVTLVSGNDIATAFVPSGKSTGTYEAHELRDSDRGVLSACEIINTEIKGALIGKEPIQKEIDSLLISLDGTKNKTRLGGNSCIGVSFATAKLRALINGIPIWKDIALENGTEPKVPCFYMNMINGGVHADFALPFQEYIVVLNEDLPRTSYENGKIIFEELGKSIRGEFGEVKMGDEGGYSPRTLDIKKPFNLLAKAIKPYSKVSLAIDVAASELWKDGKYELQDKSYTEDQLYDLYETLHAEFPLRSIEDPFAEDEVDSFYKITKKFESDTLIVGDDLTVTNPERVADMIRRNAANALIIKPNQIGTLTETYETIRLARQAGWQIIVSHRSGDTPGTFIADLSVGVGAYGIKAGSPIPLERRVKYERIIEIAEKELDM